MNTIAQVRRLAEAIIQLIGQPTPYEIGYNLYKDGFGVSDLWSAVRNDAELDQAYEGYCEAQNESNRI